MRSVTVLAPAKLNLTLDVTGTRPDGYHTLDMIMQAVSLRERVTLRRSRGLSLSLPGSRVPANEHNTAWRARPSRWTSMCPCARAWRAAAPTPPPFWWV